MCIRDRFDNQERRNVIVKLVCKRSLKFTKHNLEKLRPRFFALASTTPVFGLERVCPRKVGPWLWPGICFFLIP